MMRCTCFADWQGDFAATNNATSVARITPCLIIPSASPQITIKAIYAKAVQDFGMPDVHFLRDRPGSD
jgi:hypothetical protein